jgi:hypothetical protein
MKSVKIALQRQHDEINVYIEEYISNVKINAFWRDNILLSIQRVTKFTI